MQPKFLPEQQIVLKTDVEKLPRLVTAYKVTKTDITYEVVQATNVSYHYDYEMELIESGEKKPAGFGN